MQGWEGKAHLHEGRIIVRSRGVGRGGHGGTEVVVAGAEALVRQARSIGNDVHANRETALHAAEV